MKLFGAVIAYSEEPYLYYSLSSLYPAVDKLIVIEGYCLEYKGFNTGNDYITRTIKRIDSQNKAIYRNVGNVDTKSDLREAYLKEIEKLATPGDWVVEMDADEGWRPEHLNILKEQPEETVSIMFPFDNFIGDFQHIFYRPPEYFRYKPKFLDKYGRGMANDMYQERVFRFQDGLNFKGNHTAVKDKNGKYLYSDLEYQERRIYLPMDSIERWTHYGFVGPKDRLFHKCLYYYHWRDEKNLPFEKAREYAYTDPRYWYCMFGDASQLIIDGYNVKHVPDYNHPKPYNEHLFEKLSRRQIFDGNF